MSHSELELPAHPVQPIAAAATRQIRGAVLRPGRPLSEARFGGDDDTATTHFGAYAGDRLVGVASIYRELMPGEKDDGAWRLRGMATLPEVRGAGYGKALVAACVHHVALQGGTMLWCNARTEAAGFYQKLGFAIIGEEFDIPTVGPHFVMWRRINGAAGTGQ